FMFKMVTDKHKALAGFSLLQVSLALAIIAMISVAVLPGYKSIPEKNATTTTKMDEILKALRRYQLIQGRLPCPADPALATSSTNYGVAAVNSGSGNCIGSAPAAAYADTTNHIAIGM